MVITATRKIGSVELGAGEGLVIPVMDQSFWMFQFLDKKFYYLDHSWNACFDYCRCF